MATPELGIALDTVCSIVVRAREFDAQEAVVEEDYGSNPIDEDFRSVLTAYPDDPTFQELQSVIDGLNEDEQSALVALVWAVVKAAWTYAVLRAKHRDDAVEEMIGEVAAP